MPDFRLLQLSDLHVSRDADSRIRGIPTQITLEEVVDWLREEESRVDRLVITGDITNDEHPDSYTAVRGLLEPWLDRLAIVPGNHDDRSVMREVFGDVIDAQSPEIAPKDDRINFSFHCGSWLCIGLDTHLNGKVPGRIGEPQIHWLRDRIAEHSSDPMILFCHHPPVDVGSNWLDRIGLTDRELLRDVLDEFSTVRFVCCGHVHHEFSGQAGSAQVVTSPSTGLQFNPVGDSVVVAADAPGYRVIELTGQEIASQVVRMPKVRFVPQDAS